MRRGAEGSLAVMLVVALAASAYAEKPAPKKQSAQEKKRQQLLDELGLKKVDTPPPPPPALPPAPATPEEPSEARPGPTDHKAPAPAAQAGPSFRRAIHPLLGTCQLCHRPGAAAGATRLQLTGDAATDYAAIRPFVNPGNPPASALIAKASGQMHAGGAPWPAGSDAQTRVLAWIGKGARLDGAAAPPIAAAPPVTAPAPGRPALPATPAAKAPATPAAPAPAEVPAAEAPAAPAAPLEAPAPTATPPKFASAHAVLMASCSPCHRAGAPAAATRLLLSGDLAADEAAARLVVDPATPALSPLVTKARGELHAGGVVLPPGDPRLGALIAWIESASATAATPPPAAAPALAAAPMPGPAPTPLAAPSPTPVAYAHGAGLRLGRDFMLNGRFDLNYERHQFSGNPFEDGSTAALRSYHHFLFLSRESASDPFGLSVEMLSLQFWEAHARLGGGARPWRLVIAGGKIVVPFGADPLTHQSYGGLAGFDQPILPVIWTQEGVAAHLTVGRGRLLVTDDLFAVHGYALPHEDSVLNLKTDFSPDDDVRIGWGNRLGVSAFFASAWYSAYFNPLGFGRRLFMQAVDLTVWRPRPVPVLGHFSAAAGLLRADVSGGGHDLDYYHFGSYFQLRYHPTDWLYLQYRQGLWTFNNRRGVIVDETRLGPEDGSTHNFAIVARCRGLSVGLAYFFILEKAGEIPNDFLRASVTYEF